jgi:hypothetical protein
MVTIAPAEPEVGETLVMLGGGGGGADTVKVAPFVEKPLTVATTLPVVAPVGTGATMLVPFHELGVPLVPLNVIALATVPKPAPEIVTGVPIGAGFGDIPVITGIAKNDLELLMPPVILTTTSALPGGRLLGTGTTMVLLPQDDGFPVIPPIVTLLVPWAVPKFVPRIVSGEPTGEGGPTVGEMLVMLGGGGKTVKDNWFVAISFTVTMRLPVVAPVGTGTVMESPAQVAGLAIVPLKVTTLVIVPNPAPLMVTEAPTGAEPGDTPVMTGITRNDCVLLEVPLTATVISAFPAPRLLGTGTTIVVSFQDEGVVEIPPNVTVLVP